MSTDETERIKKLIEEVVISVIGRYTLRIVLTVMLLSGTILSTGFYIGVQLAKIHGTIEGVSKANDAHDARLLAIERSAVSPRTRWTMNMMLRYTTKLREQNPMISVPDVQLIQNDLIHEIAP